MKNMHYDNLNGLRTYACLGIIAMHIQANTNYQIFGWVWNKFIPSLTLGVYLFLIVSGFGMFCGYYQKFKNKTIDLNYFFKRRYVKLLPFFSLLIVLDILMERTKSSIIEGMTEMTMAFGLLPNNNPTVIGVGWTLGVIFLFYMLFPFFVFLCWSKLRAWISFGVSLLLNAFMVTYWMGPQYVVSGFSARHSFLYCAPFFIGGGLLYLYRENIQKFIFDNKIISNFTVICTIVIFYVTLNLKTKWIEATLILFIIIVSYAMGGDNKILNNKFTKFVSKISFEMYLAHMLIFRAIEKAHLIYSFGNGWIGYLSTYACVVVLLIAMITMYKKIEEFITNKITIMANKKNYRTNNK